MTKYAKIFLDKRTYANQIINLSWPNIYNFILNLVEFFTHLFSLTNRQYRRLLNYIWKVLFTILEVTLEELYQYLNKIGAADLFTFAKKILILTFHFLCYGCYFQPQTRLVLKILVLHLKIKALAKQKKKKKKLGT